MDPYSSNPDLSQTNQYHQSRMGEYYKSQPSPPRQSGEPQGCEIPRSSSPHSHREQKARDITQTEASASYLTQQDLDALDENARIEHAIKLSQEACGETVFPKQKPSVPPEEGACALPHLQHQASCTPASNDGQMLIESRNFFFPEDKKARIGKTR
ncbi:hypothetical protein [Endozoicomonas atrinae]|uniref:hypothetical protein n=1 Tax=Endozoicomonas atrinae TaxID=1333660 RepID=UPI0008262522|nr:hypothetical protein [Endozoicomonas atrinae]